MIQGFWKAAEADPKRIALVDADDKEYTAGEILSAANQIVHGLKSHGFAPGDCVAMLLPNGVEVVQMLAGTMQCAAFLASLNTSLTSAELGYIIRDSESKFFIFHERFAEQAIGAIKEAGIDPKHCFEVRSSDDDNSDYPSFASLLAGQPTTRPEQTPSGQFMQYTSGTTGKPKGIKRALLPMDADMLVGFMGMHLAKFDILPGGDGVHLCPAPMYHMAPLSYAWFSLHLEHKVVLLSSWDPERALQMIDKHRVTQMQMVPTHFHRLLALPKAVRDKYDVSSLRNVLHAAAPCPIDTKRQMLEWFGPVVYEYYGATEGGGSLIKPKEWLEHPGAGGRAWEGAEIHVFDDDGEPCPPGTPGTIYMLLMQDFEYRGDKKKTADNRRGNLFTVGDIGFLDEDGYLFLCDRKIDMIISGGVNIYPAEIENTLMGHPDVVDVAVFGIPNKEWGESVKAVVQLTDGLAPTPDLEKQIIEYCTAHIAKYKVPRSVDFSAALPRDGSGKLHKRTLRAPYWQGNDTRI